MTKIILWLWRGILIIAALGLLIWLFVQNLVISGRLEIVKDFCQSSNFIANFYPKIRVGEIEAEEDFCFQRIIIEPVYFKVKIPRTFNQVKVKIFYQNEKQSLFQIGLLRKKIEPTDWQFQLKPLENQVLDQLNWSKMTESGITFWQKEKKFESIHQFVNNLPEDKRVATFNYTFSQEAVRNPSKVIVWNLKTPLEYIDYLIANYQSPQIKNEWKIAQAEFFVNPDFMTDHNLEFILSMPGLDENRAEIKISRIEVFLNRELVDFENLMIDSKRFVEEKIKRVFYKSKI